MDRGDWRATVQCRKRVRHDLVTKQQQFLIKTSQIDKDCLLADTAKLHEMMSYLSLSTYGLRWLSDKEPTC